MTFPSGNCVTDGQTQFCLARHCVIHISYRAHTIAAFSHKPKGSFNTRNCILISCELPWPWMALRQYLELHRIIIIIIIFPMPRVVKSALVWRLAMFGRCSQMPAAKGGAN